MITASTSSRFSAEATPAPSAATARSISSPPSSSSALSARAQTPLVSRSRRALSMMSKSVGVLAVVVPPARRASIAARPA